MGSFTCSVASRRLSRGHPALAECARSMCAQSPASRLRKCTRAHYRPARQTLPKTPDANTADFLLSRKAAWRAVGSASALCWLVPRSPSHLHTSSTSGVDLRNRLVNPALSCSDLGRLQRWQANLVRADLFHSDGNRHLIRLCMDAAEVRELMDGSPASCQPQSLRSEYIHH